LQVLVQLLGCGLQWYLHKFHVGKRDIEACPKEGIKAGEGSGTRYGEGLN